MRQRGWFETEFPDRNYGVFGSHSVSIETGHRVDALTRFKLFGTISDRDRSPGELI
jgi:hypothetical protein